MTGQQRPEDEGDSGVAGGRLPPLGREKPPPPPPGKQPQPQSQSQSRPSSGKSALAQPPPPPAKPESAGPGKRPGKPAQQPQQHQPSASMLAKTAKGNDGSIPLPIQSIDDTPRPFLHLKRGEVDEVKQVLEQYRRHRGVPARDYAIQCLSVAQNFKEKPWLHQVRLAMTFTETGVRKMTAKSSHNLLGPQIIAEADQ